MFDGKLAKDFLKHINSMSFEELDKRATAAQECGMYSIISGMDAPQIIFLDDERNIEDVTWVKYPQSDINITVRTFDEWVAIIPYVKDWDNTYFSLDHDLQDFNEDGSENTGYTCLKWLCDYIIDNDIKPNKLNVIIHTKNPIGGVNMLTYHNNFIKFVLKIGP